MKVFDKEQYRKATGRGVNEELPAWAIACDGKTATRTGLPGRAYGVFICGEHLVSERWCIEVTSNQTGKVFSRERFIDVEGRGGNLGYEECRGWVDECDGKPVIVDNEGYLQCEGYAVVDEWCIEAPGEKKGEEKEVYTIKDFASGKIAVFVAKKDFKTFLQLCEDEGMKWATGSSPTRWIPQGVDDGCWFTFSTIKGFATPRLFYSVDGRTCKELGMTLVPFPDMAGSEPKPESGTRIVITFDGAKTFADLYNDGKRVLRETARCNPADEYDAHKGAVIALGRLYGKEPETTEKPEELQTVHEVERCAKKGEFVKIVKKFGTVAEKYENGDILEVKSADSEGWVRLRGQKVLTAPDEYVVLEGYKPEEAPKPEGKKKPEKHSKFSVGDRVVCTCEYCGNAKTKGARGKVVEVEKRPNGEDDIAVEFDKNIDGHSCNDAGKYGYCWWCDPSILKKLETHFGFSVGDRVVCIRNNGAANVYTKGVHGTVVMFDNGLVSTVGVEFDKYVNGHSFDGKGKDGHCWWCMPSSLRHE